jgi:hypothetical protein
MTASTASTWKGAVVTVLCTIHYCTPPYLLVLDRVSEGKMTVSEHDGFDGCYQNLLLLVLR